MTKLTRKQRREQGGFIPQYNGKQPITKAEYEANNGVPAPPKADKVRKYGEIKAVLPKKAEVAQ